MKTQKQLPVSQKFYSELRSRIHHVLGLTGRLSCEVDTLCLLDRYLTSGNMPDNGTSTDILLILQLLKPEIDKAVARSRSARERALLRRKAKEQAALEQPAAEVERENRLAVTQDVPVEAAMKPGSVPSATRGRHYFYSRLLR